MNNDPLSLFHPLVAEWFTDSYVAATEIQARSWRAIARGEHVLMSAATGSGKTLAAFLWALDQLIRGRLAPGAVRVLYVSPLKALNNDVRRNLLRPLAQLHRLFQQRGQFFPTIAVATRSGDTPPGDRRRMQRHPPEILITTPESFNLLLSSAGGRAMLTEVETVILDEIHALIGSRRGTYLMTAVERLVRLCGEFQRIALSATVNPMDIAAGFVGGFVMQGEQDAPHYTPRRVVAVAARTSKRFDLQVRMPAQTAATAEARDFWAPYAELIGRQVGANRSTLIFTNSRRLCEKLAFLINSQAGERLAYAHHGSLSREIRAQVESQMKSGALRAIVATSSLELGIDIGALDEVLLVQSPASVAETIQRVGRAGHQVGEISRGILYPSHAIDGVKAAVLVEAATAGDIEKVHPPRAPLDVLAQVVLSMCAFEAWHPQALFNWIRTSFAYQDLSWRHFERVLEMLEGRYGDARLRELQPRIAYDRVGRTLKARKGALMALYASGGVIPDRGYYHLRQRETGAKIGELDEEFVWEARIGQTFALGTQNWRIVRITASDVLVSPAAAGSPVAPFWRAENTGRGYHLSARLGEFLEMADSQLETKQWAERLQRSYRLDAHAAAYLTDALRRQKAETGVDLPHRHHLVLEHTSFGAGGAAGRQFVWHTLWGGRINQPLAIALEEAWRERFGSLPQVLATDDVITLQTAQEAGPEEFMALVGPDNFQELLQRRLAATGFFAARFRECAGRALLLPRRSLQMRMPLWLNRLRAQKLMTAMADRPDFPILLETWRTCLQDEFDLPQLRILLEELAQGTIGWSFCRTAHPSPLAQSGAWRQINTYMYQSDQSPADAPGGDMIADLLQQVSLDPLLRPRISPELVAAFEDKRQRLAQGYAPASADELLEWVKERTLLPLAEWRTLLQAIARDQRLAAEALVAPIAAKLVLIEAGSATGGPAEPLVAALEQLRRLLAGLYGDKLPVRCSLLSGEAVEPTLMAGSLQDEAPDGVSIAAIVLAEWVRFYGPRSSDAIGRMSGMPADRLAEALNELIDSQTLIFGHLVAGSDAPQFCDRENFEVLLRMLRHTSTPAFEMLEAARLPLFLAQYQGIVRPGDGQQALLDCITQLEGYAAPAALWESDILPARIAGYRKEALDQLMQEEALLWIGRPGRKVFLNFESDLDLLQEPAPDGSMDGAADSEPACLPEGDGRYPFLVLQQRSGLGQAALNDCLWQAVWQGRLTNDTFAALRRGIETRFVAPTVPSGSGGRAPRRGRRRSPGGAHLRPHRESRLLLPGNWYRLPDPEGSEDLLEKEERNKERVRLVLDRYGIVFRELLARELPVLQWGALFRSLRLMELSGEVLAGAFFAGIPGLQFISPRALRKISHKLSEDAIFWINAADPASVCGLSLDALTRELPRRMPSHHLVYHGSRLVMISLQHAKALQIRVPADHDQLGAYFGFLQHLFDRPLRALRSVHIETINGEPAAQQNAYAARLKERFDTAIDYRGISLYRPFPA